MNVVGPIIFTAADGYRMETRDVNVDLRARTMQSRGAVEGQMPLGSFSADQLQADLPDRTVVLSGRRALAYRPGRPQMSGVNRLRLLALSALLLAVAPAAGQRAARRSAASTATRRSTSAPTGSRCRTAPTARSSPAMSSPARAI